MKFFLFFILIFIISLQSSQNDDDNLCPTEVGEEECLSTKLENPEFKCCVQKQGKGCFSISFTNFIWGSDIIYKAMQKEYNSIKDISYPNSNYEGKCENKEISFNIKEMEFTEEEQDIIISNNYCLNYHMNAINQKPSNIKSKENCFNGEILSSSKDLGLVCGYYKFTIFSDYGEKTIETCFLLNPSILKQSTLDEGAKSIMDQIAKDLSADGKYNSYTCKFYFSNEDLSNEEIGGIYDSKSGKIEEIPNSTKIIIISRNLLFLFLILILL